MKFGKPDLTGLWKVSRDSPRTRKIGVSSVYLECSLSHSSKMDSLTVGPLRGFSERWSIIMYGQFRGHMHGEWERANSCRKSEASPDQ